MMGKAVCSLVKHKVIFQVSVTDWSTLPASMRLSACLSVLDFPDVVGCWVRYISVVADVQMPYSGEVFSDAAELNN